MDTTRIRQASAGTKAASESDQKAQAEANVEAPRDEVAETFDSEDTPEAGNVATATYSLRISSTSDRFESYQWPSGSSLNRFEPLALIGCNW